MAIDRNNCHTATRQGLELIHGGKWGTSRSLRRYLEQFLLQNRENTVFHLYQMFASVEEGYSPEQLKALGGYAQTLADEMQVAGLSDFPLVKNQGVVSDDMGTVFNFYRFELDLANASLKELQQAVKAVVLVAEFLQPFAYDPNETALRDCPVYCMRGLPSSIARDEDLWCVNGRDHLNGGDGVLEWCYDEADATSLLAEMRKHPHQFKDLSAAPYQEVFKSGGTHPLIREALSA